MTEQVEGQLSIFDLGLPSGKTSPEPSAPIRDRTSKPSSTRSAPSAADTLMFLNLRKEAGGSLLGASWETVSALPGVSMTLNTGESPNAVRESTLSQILDLSAPEKYSLSARACAGIIRRAKRRGKELPPMLLDALMETVGLAGGLEMFEKADDDADDGLQ